MTAGTVETPRANPDVPPPRSVPGTLRRHRLLVVVALLALLVLAALASLAVGAKPIPIDVVWDAIFSPTGTEDDIVVRSLRLPRTILGIAVGVALGIAGALMQGHTRNPL
ncbi:MAG: iron chelate uptake ABC transporter family permease subunit, partial [Pseudonocardia sp.]